MTEHTPQHRTGQAGTAVAGRREEVRTRYEFHWRLAGCPQAGGIWRAVPEDVPAGLTGPTDGRYTFLWEILDKPGVDPAVALRTHADAIRQLAGSGDAWLEALADPWRGGVSGEYARRVLESTAECLDELCAALGAALRRHRGLAGPAYEQAVDALFDGVRTGFGLRTYLQEIEFETVPGCPCC